LQGTSHTLAVANVHSINFTLGLWPTGLGSTRSCARWPDTAGR
jgi:hypothetical protein